VPAHHSVGTVKEDCIDFSAQADLANVLVIFFFNF